MPKYLQTNEELGKRIRSIREYLGRSQESVAKELKINRATYIHYETGKTEPKIMTLIQLAKIFDLNLLYFVSEERPSDNEIF